ncbi:sugar transferase [Photobacterium nomapromontoriensis]|uniref:sugar transferase n=1 Tax=Photobacterium nomapromontoriensis TaxID=2910237 RepID=UPI003D0A332E
MGAQYIDRSTQIGKRAFDVLVAVVGLLLFLPLFPLIALAIKWDSNGPVFISQHRIGRARPDRTELFFMFKFRSMRQDAEAGSGAVWACKQDPRITRVGRFLRRTRLDELPQLLNVLKGEMSLIGPRPERPGFYQKLESQIPFFAERTYGLAPGITGLAQVNQGYDTSIDDVRAKLAYDHGYAMALSSFTCWLKMDFTIACKTIVIMVKGEGR